MDSLKFECKRCTECCKAYWITMLPSEAKAIAKSLGLSLKRMLEKHCNLLLQVFPMRKRDFSNPLVLGIEKFPKKIRRKLSKKATTGFFLCLPSIAFKRNNGSCIALSKNFDCLVYEARPRQCMLFPLISLKKEVNLKKAYPFCQGLKGSEKINFKVNIAHYKSTKNYFEKIKKQGFGKVWKQWPSECIVLFENEKIAEIKEKEFFKVLNS